MKVFVSAKLWRDPNTRLMGGSPGSRPKENEPIYSLQSKITLTPKQLALIMKREIVLPGGVKGEVMSYDHRVNCLKAEGSLRSHKMPYLKLLKKARWKIIRKNLLKGDKIP